MASATGLLLLMALALNAASGMPTQHAQTIGERLSDEGQQTPTDLTKPPSTSHSRETTALAYKVDNRGAHEDRLTEEFVEQYGIRTRRSPDPAPKRFGFSIGTAISANNDATKREVASATTTTKRPLPFWKRRTSTTKRPTIRPEALTTKRAFPRWKPSTTTAKPATAATTKRTVFKWTRTAATTKRPSITTKRPIPKWLQRTTSTKRPTTTTKRTKTTKQTTTRRPKPTKRTTTRRPPTKRTTTKRPTTRSFFAKRLTTESFFSRRQTTRRTTTKRPTIKTTTKRPTTTTKRPTTTTKRPRTTTRRTTTRRSAARPFTVATKRPTPTTKRFAPFSPRGAKRISVTQRPFRFTARPSSANTTPKAPSRPKTDPIPKDADPLTSILMQIASLSPRRTIGSPSVLLAIAALAKPTSPDQPAVRLDPQQSGFHLGLRHQPEGACAPCMPTFLVDLEKCHPCVVIR